MDLPTEIVSMITDILPLKDRASIYSTCNSIFACQENDQFFLECKRIYASLTEFQTHIYLHYNMFTHALQNTKIAIKYYHFYHTKVTMLYPISHYFKFLHGNVDSAIFLYSILGQPDQKQITSIFYEFVVEKDQILCQWLLNQSPFIKKDISADKIKKYLCYPFDIKFTRWCVNQFNINLSKRKFTEIFLQAIGQNETENALWALDNAPFILASDKTHRYFRAACMSNNIEIATVFCKQCPGYSFVCIDGIIYYRIDY